MIYLQFHQARNEEIDREQAGATRKFCYYSEISLHSEFLLCSENFTCSETLCSLFLCTNDPVLVNFISTLTVIILVRLDWYFHLFVRLYKPFFRQFVENFLLKAFSITGPCFWPSFALFSLLFLSLYRQPNTPL